MKKHFLIALVLMLNLSINNTFSQSNPCCNFYDTGQELGIEGETFGIALGDIDNDGDVDAVTVDAYDDMEVYLNDGSGVFTFDQTYGSSESWFGVYLNDVDADDDLDIIVAGFYAGSGCEIWKNNGLGNFTFSQGNIASSFGMEELAIGDVDGNGSPDIFAPAYSGGNSEVWLNDGTGNFTDSNQDLAGSSCTQAVLADLDGDIDLDVFVSRTNGSPNMVWINDGTGIYANSGQELGSAFSSGADAADVDGDGDMDIVVSNWQVPSQVWLNDGNAGFSEGYQIQNDNYAKSIVLNDVDYDYDADVIIGSYGSNGLQVWSNDGLGNFTLCYENANSLYAHDLAVADMNNDWMPDIWAGNFSSSGGDHVFVQETPVFVYDTVYLCQGDSFFVGGAWQFAEGDFLENINCDTLSWYHLSEVLIDTSIMQSNDTLYALPDYMAYQWFNCETMEAVAGANDYYFVPGQSGLYAVEIAEQSCVDTTNCYFVLILGKHDDIARQIVISPNPAASHVRIFNPWPGNSIISLLDLTGRKLIQASMYGQWAQLNLSSLLPGIYLVKIEMEEYTVIHKFIKK
ncbi:MAG: T9SS type A sorting domain-containing protein [Bacteroidales bacterium]|nr:T9SS type A sorting domain-containing protein [Bacteroidales bacterium]